MPRAQRAARLRQVRAAKKHLRDDAEDRPQAASARRAQSLLSPAGILRLQHAIGKRAVQRLVVQRQPSEAVEAESAKTQEIPRLVASITLDNGGKLRGESAAPGHEGKIVIESLSFSQGSTGRGRSEKSEGESPRLVELTLTKRRDSSSVALMKAAMSGDRVTSAQFEFLSQNPDGSIEARMTLDFSNGYVTSYAMGGDDYESFTMQFESPK
jgi:type VI protein secretion system component Hcp